MNRKKIIAGNWKMNGCAQENESLLHGLLEGIDQRNSAEVVVFPPFPYLAQVQQLCESNVISWGAQDLSQYESGAYTGSVSGAMLKELGCQYVLVGHSERRALFGDTGAIVADKFALAQINGLVPVLCVGESLQERESGDTNTVVRQQLDSVVQRCGLEAFADAVIAYEPVWAIGTGKTPSIQQVEETHAYIRGVISEQSPNLGSALRILYGGSVKAENALDIFSLPNVDGGLVGGASLRASDFLPIINCICELKI